MHERERRRVLSPRISRHSDPIRVRARSKQVPSNTEGNEKSNDYPNQQPEQLARSPDGIRISSGELNDRLSIQPVCAGWCFLPGSCWCVVGHGGPIKEKQ